MIMGCKGDHVWMRTMKAEICSREKEAEKNRERESQREIKTKRETRDDQGFSKALTINQLAVAAAPPTTIVAELAFR